MKQLLDPSELRSFRDRGAARVPDSLSRYIDQQLGIKNRRDRREVFPHGRFWLWLEMWCPTLVGEKHPYDFIEIQVNAFYRGVLPYLAYGMDDPAALRRATFLVNLIDELMEKQYHWYASAAPLPLVEVLAGFADVFTTLYLGSPRDLVVAWDLDEQGWLMPAFGEVIRAVEAHESCCAEIRVNVHWW